MLKRLAFFISLSASSVAISADAGWQMVAWSSTGSLWYSRASDLAALSGQKRKIWVKQDHSRDKTMKSRETKTLYLIDCGDLSLSALSSVSTAPDGSVLNSWDVPEYRATAQRVVPETVGEGLLRSVCRAGTPWNLPG